MYFHPTMKYDLTIKSTNQEVHMTDKARVPAYVEGDLVSVRYGDSGRVVCTIVDGPHEYTAWERKKLIEAETNRGHSTKRIATTYYRAKPVGSEKLIRAMGGRIIRATAPEAPEA